MQNKEEIIQDLIDRNGYQSYLEIGSQNGGSFNAIKCPLKTSVDPDPNAQASYVMTSDAFFETVGGEYDIVFIDGWHSAEQVEKDIVNASKRLSKNGAIVVHDLLPTLEIQTLIPRVNKQWVGTCYKAFIGFRKKYPQVKSYTHGIDWGVGVILPQGQVFEEGFADQTITFDEFMADKDILLGLI